MGRTGNRHLNPTKVIELIPDAAAVDNLRSFKFLNSDKVISNLKSELPAYLAATDGTSSTVDLLVWCKRHSETLPHWTSACKTVCAHISTFSTWCYNMLILCYFKRDDRSTAGGSSIFYRNQGALSQGACNLQQYKLPTLKLGRLQGHQTGSQSATIATLQVRGQILLPLHITLSHARTSTLLQ